jgi:hypothetical protein
MYCYEGSQAVIIRPSGKGRLERRQGVRKEEKVGKLKLQQRENMNRILLHFIRILKHGAHVNNILKFFLHLDIRCK